MMSITTYKAFAIFVLVAMGASGCSSLNLAFIVRERVTEELGFSVISQNGSDSYSVGAILADVNPGLDSRLGSRSQQPLCNSREILKVPIESIAVNPPPSDLEDVSRTVGPIPPEVSRLLNPDWKVSTGSFGGMQSTSLPESDIRRMIQGAPKGCHEAMAASISNGRKVHIISGLLSIVAYYDITLRGPVDFDFERFRKSLLLGSSPYVDPYSGTRPFVNASLVEFPSTLSDLSRYRLLIDSAVGYRMREITKEDL
jgi:hypothetical protein